MGDKDFRKYTWEEILALPEGAKLHDEVYSVSPRIRFIISRGYASLLAYIGIPLDHPMAGYDYEEMNIKPHWEFTHSDKGDGIYLPADYWWYGWDYGHGGDFLFIDEGKPRGVSLKYMNPDWLKKNEKFFKKYLEKDSRKKWLLEDVIQDSRKTLENFKEVMLLEEQWTKDKNGRNRT